MTSSTAKRIVRASKQNDNLFSMNLKRLRLELGLTQLDIAKQLNVSIQSISSMEATARQAMSADKVEQYAAIIGIPGQMVIEGLKMERANKLKISSSTVEGPELCRLVANWFCDTAGRVNGNAVASSEIVSDSLIKSGHHVRVSSVKAAIGSLHSGKKISLVRDGIETGNNSIFKILEKGWKFAHASEAGHIVMGETQPDEVIIKESVKEDILIPQKDPPMKIPTPVLEVHIPDEKVQESISEMIIVIPDEPESPEMIRGRELQETFAYQLNTLMHDAESWRNFSPKLVLVMREQKLLQEALEASQYENLRLSEEMQTLQNQASLTEEELLGLRSAKDILNHLKLVAEIGGTEFGMVKLTMGSVLPSGNEAQTLILAADTFARI